MPVLTAIAPLSGSSLQGHADDGCHQADPSALDRSSSSSWTVSKYLFHRPKRSTTPAGALDQVRVSDVMLLSFCQPLAL